jgi:hypothetical protein
MSHRYLLGEETDQTRTELGPLPCYHTWPLRARKMVSIYTDILQKRHLSLCRTLRLILHSLQRDLPVTTARCPFCSRATSWSLRGSSRGFQLHHVNRALGDDIYLCFLCRYLLTLVSNWACKDITNIKLYRHCQILISKGQTNGSSANTAR